VSNSQNRLEQAEQRLTAAMGRLESVLDAKASAGGPQGQSDAPLASELSRLQSENAELKALVGQASSSLDATIDKLKQQMSGPVARPSSTRG